MVDITEGFLSLMMDNGDVREDLRVPEGDLGKEIESKFAAGEEMLVSAPVWVNAFNPLFFLFVTVARWLFSLFGRLLCFQLWVKNLQWLSNPWPNRKKDWAAQAATCYTLTNLLHLFFWFYLSPKLWPSQATSNIFVIVFLFSSKTVLNLSSQFAFSLVRGLILSVCSPPFPPQVFTLYIPERQIMGSICPFFFILKFLNSN